MPRSPAPRFRRRLAAACSIPVLLVSGCALGPDTIAIRPLPVAAPPVAAPPGAAAHPVAVYAAMAPGVDPQRVGARKNGYDMDTGELFADPALPTVVADALRDALVRRGFVVAGAAVPPPAGAPLVTARVDRFRNTFSPGIFSSATDAEVVLGITVRAPDGTARFDATVTGRDHRDGLTLMTSVVARNALERALADAISRLLADPRFLFSLSGPAGA